MKCGGYVWYRARFNSWTAFLRWSVFFITSWRWNSLRLCVCWVHKMCFVANMMCTVCDVLWVGGGLDWETTRHHDAAKLRQNWGHAFCTFSTEIICTINIVAIIKVIKLGQKNLIVFFKLLEQSGRYGRGLIIAVHCTVGRVGTAMWPLGCWHTGEGSREGLRKAQMVQMVH